MKQVKQLRSNIAVISLAVCSGAEALDVEKIRALGLVVMLQEASSFCFDSSTETTCHAKHGQQKEQSQVQELEARIAHFFGTKRLIFSFTRTMLICSCEL